MGSEGHSAAFPACAHPSELGQLKMAPDTDQSPFPPLRTTRVGKAQRKNLGIPTQPIHCNKRKNNGFNYYDYYVLVLCYSLK